VWKQATVDYISVRNNVNPFKLQRDIVAYMDIITELGAQNKPRENNFCICAKLVALNKKKLRHEHLTSVTL
jgi:hypothetical protein